jgi:hypothetical protein
MINYAKRERKSKCGALNKPCGQSKQNRRKEYAWKDYSVK